MNYSSTKGLLTEIACQQAFTEVGILLSQPIISDSRYDYIAEINNQFYKIQCKSSTWLDKEKQDAFVFRVSSQNWNNGERHSYQGQVDFFFTTFENENYLIPIEDVGVSSKTLRLFSNLDEKNISWAKDYEFLTILQNKLNYQLPNHIFSDERDKTYLEVLYNKKQSQNTKNYCIDCHKEISLQTTRCVECYKKLKTQNSINIEREVLKLKIRTLPFTTIAKEYDVTDNAIRKWCDKYDLPRKKSDIKQISDEDWNLI